MTRIARRDFTKQSLGIAGALSLGVCGPFEATRAIEANLTSKIRVGQIGTIHGHADGKMLAARKLSDQFEVVGIVEENEAQRKKAQANTAYADLAWMTVDQMISDPGIELVLIETDIHDLLPMAERCLLAGKHIHLDKPAGSSMSHFRRVAKIAQQKQKLIQMGYMFRSNPAFQFLFEAVRKGWLGDVFEIDCVMSKKVGDSDRQQLARYRGGSMFELGCHLIDAVVRMLGKPDQIIPMNLRSRASDPLYDNCLAIFKYPLATAAIRSSVIEVDGSGRRQMVVCGTKGTIAIEPLEPPQLTLTLDSDQGSYRKGTQAVTLPQSVGRYDAELATLGKAIRGQSEFDYSIEHDLLVQSCVLQASEMPLD